MLTFVPIPPFSTELNLKYTQFQDNLHYQLFQLFKISSTCSPIFSTNFKTRFLSSKRRKKKTKNPFSFLSTYFSYGTFPFVTLIRMEVSQSCARRIFKLVFFEKTDYERNSFLSNLERGYTRVDEI